MSDNYNIEEIKEKVNENNKKINDILSEVQKVIVGQEYLLKRLLVGILSCGHILLEGVPGLAKTLSIKSVADVIDASFKRLQFTPDLLPADLIGTLIYNQKKNEFIAKKGPIFANFILADEINRSPAKVQSALLEAMQERQVTISDTTYILPKPFMVMATQNPLEQEGTYPLPEAQVDRFMLKVLIKYPSKEEEIIILNRMMNNQNEIKLKKVISPEDILNMQNIVDSIYMENKIKDYIVNLVFATREPEKYNNLKELQQLIECGASPRASIALAKAAKAHAFISRRSYVIPDDIKAIGKDVLRHRIILSYEAEAENINQEDIITNIFNEIQVP